VACLTGLIGNQAAMLCIDARLTGDVTHNASRKNPSVTVTGVNGHQL